MSPPLGAMMPLVTRYFSISTQMLVNVLFLTLEGDGCLAANVINEVEGLAQNFACLAVCDTNEGLRVVIVQDSNLYRHA